MGIDFVARAMAAQNCGVSSWNDLTDKPFGEAVQWVEIANSEIVKPTQGSNGRFSVSVKPSNGRRLEFGERYKVVITSGPLESTLVSFEDTAKTNAVSKIPFLGDSNGDIYVEDHVPLTQSYSILFNTSSSSMITMFGATIKVYHNTPVTVPLDEKYIPDTIARVTPVFDLSDLGMPELVVGGDPQEFQCDTTEIVAAMRRGAVGFKIPTDYGTVTIFGPTLEIDGADAPQLTCAFYLEGMFGDVCITATTTTISVVSVVRFGGNTSAENWLFKDEYINDYRNDLPYLTNNVSYTCFVDGVEIATTTVIENNAFFSDGHVMLSYWAVDIGYPEQSIMWQFSPDSDKGSGTVSIRIND